MEQYFDEIAKLTRGSGSHALSQEVWKDVKALHRSMVDERWRTKLAQIRDWAPVRNKSTIEQIEVLRRISRLGSRSPFSSRVTPKGLWSDGEFPCLNGWNCVAQLGGGSFDEGSNSNVYVQPSPVMSGPGAIQNTAVVQTRPDQNEISLGVAAGFGPFPYSGYYGGPTTEVWPTSETVGELSYNRASGSIYKTFGFPAGSAPGALMVTCGVKFPPTYSTYAMGLEPCYAEAGVSEPETTVYVCCAAYLDVWCEWDVGWGAHAKFAANNETIFIYDAWFTKNKHLESDNFSNPDLTQPMQLQATISQPDLRSNILVVGLTVEVSAWIVKPSSSCWIDFTGGTQQPVAYYPPPTYSYAGFGTQGPPVQVAYLNICGI